jgi:hypothetical protein
VQISNGVNEQVCKPIAEKVAERARALAPVDTGAYRDSIHVETDVRTDASDWAHSRVVADDPKAMAIESRMGILARALGGTSRSKEMRASRTAARDFKRSFMGRRKKRAPKKRSVGERWRAFMGRR